MWFVVYVESCICVNWFIYWEVRRGGDQNRKSLCRWYSILHGFRALIYCHYLAFLMNPVFLCATLVQDVLSCLCSHRIRISVHYRTGIHMMTWVHCKCSFLCIPLLGTYFGSGLLRYLVLVFHLQAHVVT